MISRKDTFIYISHIKISPYPGISPTLYMGYYGSTLFYDVLKITKSTNFNNIINNLPFIANYYENKRISFKFDSTISVSLQYAKSSGEGDWILISEENGEHFNSITVHNHFNNYTFSICDWHSQNDDYISEATIFTICIPVDDTELYDLVTYFIKHIIYSVNNNVFFILYTPFLYLSDDIEKTMKYIIDKYDIQCFLVRNNQNDIFSILTPYKIPILMIESDFGIVCKSKYIFYFACTYDSVMSTSINNGVLLGVKKYIYVTYNNKNIDIAYTFLYRILYEIFIDDFDLQVVNYNDDLISEISSLTEKTFIYIGLQPKIDFEFTKKVTESNYNRNLVTLIHFHGEIKYFQSRINMNNQIFTLYHPTETTELSSVKNKFEKKYINIYEMYFLYNLGILQFIISSKYQCYKII